MISVNRLPKRYTEKKYFSASDGKYIPGFEFDASSLKLGDSIDWIEAKLFIDGSLNDGSLRGNALLVKGKTKKN